MGATSSTPDQSLRDRLRPLVASVLRVSASDFDDETAFAALGMDSLLAAELTAMVEDEMGIELPASTVLEHASLTALAAHLSAGARAPLGDAGAAADARLARMLTDAVLPDDIVPATRRTPPGNSRRRILLTGATGFIGAHLLSRLTKDAGVDVVCLVRGDPRVARERVHEALVRHGAARDGALPRFTVAQGDLSHRWLGLDAYPFAALASSIDEIVHCAAAVDWVQPYETLRDANVLGTIELLRLAAHERATRFTFLSSLAVCYTTARQEPATEGEDPLGGLSGLHFGYAQSKCVAESLVRQAASRGLPISILRPALVTGHSVTGESNPDDLLSRILRGCAQMSLAPDLDWVLDCVAIDHLVEVVARLRHSPAAPPVIHVASPEGRHWRECALWMRLRGYPVEMVPYAAWVRALRDMAHAPEHPLHPLRPFFAHSIAQAGGLSVPELYEEGRRRAVTFARSSNALRSVALPCPRLDAHLLGRYFDDFVRRGALGAPSGGAGATPARRQGSRPTPVRESTPASALLGRLRDPLTRALAAKLDDPTVRIVEGTASPMGSDDSVVAELTSWRRGSSAGLWRLTLLVDGRAGREVHRLVAKVKPSDRDVIEVGAELATLCSPGLGAAYRDHRQRIGFTRGHLRELAIYRDADAETRPYLPEVLLVQEDPARGEWIVCMELVAGAGPGAGSERAWSDAELDVALDGLAALHARWYDRTEELADASWLPPRRSTATMAAMTPLWRALADHSRPMLESWGGSDVVAAHEGLLRDVGQWWRPLGGGGQPRTLIHNDFNPRNVLLRGRDQELRLCAFDWELATLGIPQRDLMEFLCFTLPADVDASRARRLVQGYRASLEARCGTAIDPNAWDDGARAALCDILVDRLAMYTMVHRVRPQRFLPRVVRTWGTLHRIFPWPLA